MSWFEHRDLVTDGRLWAKRESEMKGETERMGTVAVGDITRAARACQAWTVIKPYLESAIA